MWYWYHRTTDFWYKLVVHLIVWLTDWRDSLFRVSPQLHHKKPQKSAAFIVFETKFTNRSFFIFWLFFDWDCSLKALFWNEKADKKIFFGNLGNFEKFFAWFRFCLRNLGNFGNEKAFFRKYADSFLILWIGIFGKIRKSCLLKRQEISHPLRPTLHKHRHQRNLVYCLDHSRFAAYFPP